MAGLVASLAAGSGLSAVRNLKTQNPSETKIETAGKEKAALNLQNMAICGYILVLDYLDSKHITYLSETNRTHNDRNSFPLPQQLIFDRPVAKAMKIIKDVEHNSDLNAINQEGNTAEQIANNKIARLIDEAMAKLQNDKIAFDIVINKALNLATITNNDTKSVALYIISTTVAETKNYEWATKITDKITNDTIKSKALLCISILAADNKDFEWAIKIADKITNENIKCDAKQYVEHQLTMMQGR